MNHCASDRAERRVASADRAANVTSKLTSGDPDVRLQTQPRYDRTYPIDGGSLPIVLYRESSAGDSELVTEMSTDRHATAMIRGILDYLLAVHLDMVFFRRDTTGCCSLLLP